MMFFAAVTPGVAPVVPPVVPPGTLGERLQSLLGLVAFLLIAFVIGRIRGHRKLPSARLLFWGIFLQFVFGVIVVKNRAFLIAINAAVDALLGFTAQGADLVFGRLSTLQGAPVSDASGNLLGYATNLGYFAFFVVPTIMFFAALTAVLYHVGVMQYVVQGLAWVMSKTMGTSGAETLSSAANIFVGQTEAPLMVKPFLAAATRSELMAVMVGGFANIASGVLGLYTVWLGPYVPDAAGHLAAACFLTAPGSLLVAKLLHPETEVPETAGGVKFRIERIDANVVDAAARGTTEGLSLALNVAAMLITFTALVALVNGLLGWTSSRFGVAPVTLQGTLGYVFRPLAWLTGINWAEAKNAGSLLGVKTVLNELIAYSEMKDLLAADPAYLSPRGRLLATYALCGFANFASVGIQVGGISSLAPSRRHDLSRIGLMAMVGGALSSLIAAAIVGILI
jgi:CNT family concentrative nucleoside transporter